MSTNWWAGDHWAITWPNCLRKLVIIMMSDHSTSSVLFVFMKYLNILNWCAYRSEFISSEGQYLKSTNQIVPFQILDRALFPKGPFAATSDGFCLVLFWGLLDFLKKKNAYPHETVFWFLFLFHNFFFTFLLFFFFWERWTWANDKSNLRIARGNWRYLSSQWSFDFPSTISSIEFDITQVCLGPYSENIGRWSFFVFSGILKSSICFQMLFRN